MGHMYKNLDKILEVFYEHPAQRFTVRELAKRTGIPKSTVQSYLVELRKKRLISKDNQAAESDLFKAKKINYFVEKLFSSGLIDYLKEAFVPSAIILFGSIRKGESIAESDIDLFVETHKKEPADLSVFERKLKHSIQLFQETSIHNLPEHLFNNVVNGIILFGSIRVKR